MRNHRAAITITLAVLAAVTFSSSSAFAAASNCDAGITKAAGKKASCKAKVYSKAYAKDVAPNADKLTKCEAKFETACAKAKDAGDCAAQTQPCATVEGAVDICVADIVENECSIVGGFCWLLGATNANCTDTCASQGMVYDSATATYAGSGGTDEHCAAVLDSLGVPAAAINTIFCGTAAIDCYYDILGARVRCTNAGTEGLPYIFGQRACACMAAP